MILPRLSHALLRRPAASIAQGITAHPGLGAPDPDLTLRQFDAYTGALQRCGLEITVIAADERFPDGHYVEDTAVIFHDAAFITRPGSDARAAEVESIAEALRGLNPVHMQGDDSRLEGGDVLFCADRVLIGLSGRSNRAGAEELAAFLRTIQPDLRVDFVPFEGVLHLKTGLNELVPGILLRDPAFVTDFPLDFAEVIDLPADEGHASNVLPINDTVLIPRGVPSVTALAVEYAANVIALDISEFRKMDGGLSCLSLRY